MSDDGNPFQSPGLEGVRGGCTSDIEVEFDFVLEDTIWFALRENHNQHAVVIRRTRIYQILAAILFGLAGLISLFGPGIMALSVGLPSLLLTIYFAYRAINISHWFRKNTGEQLERMLASRENHGVYGRCSVRLEDEGVATVRPGGHGLWRWWAVPSIVTAEGYLLIYTSSVEASLVPSRAFASEEHFNAFVANAFRLWEAKKRNSDSVE